MSEIMTPISFEKAIKWMIEERKSSKSVFGLRKAKFYRNLGDDKVSLLGEEISSTVGVAAGPNTQLAQNILVSYLSGLRFIELKTVQTMDGEELRNCISRPCILAEKEGYNCEWSTELTTKQAMEEYIKAWFLIYVAKSEFEISDDKDFLFNMSVGYDFEGITSEKIDDFIEIMKDARNSEVYQNCYDYLFANMDMFRNFCHADLANISPKICTSITLSTLHGCPPEEIEKIASYFIDVKEIHTYIKLNPTLLGYDFTRETLDSMGYTNIDFDNTHFDQDLKYEDAMPMIKRLKKLADRKELTFGVKITNTFPVKSNGQLPSEFMYMSGRALYPLSINVASKISTELKGTIPISYSGGADFMNIKAIFETGIKPITVATTILKPGGYARSHQISEAAETIADRNKIDFRALEKLADQVVSDTNYTRNRAKRAKIENTLPLFDCGVPACSDNGCPINQQIPEYLNLLVTGKVDKAFDVVVNDNVLPSITGTICPHECQSNCVRNFYDVSVGIRGAKKMIVDHEMDRFLASYVQTELQSDKKVCVVGAGPAGVSVASYLARNGVDVTVFEKESEPMGVVKYIIPKFRIADEVINQDFELSKKYGAKYVFDTEVDMDAKKLKEEYDFVIFAFGALMAGYNPVKSGRENVIDALEFLRKAKAGQVEISGNVAVIGGGDVAMDSVRAAKRGGANNAYILYRRTEEFMPAAQDEIELVKSEGVEIRQLISPLSYDGKVGVFEVMQLSDFGEDGRRKVVPTGEKIEIELDMMISATGSNVDKSVFDNNSFARNKEGYAVLNASFETSMKDVYISGDCAQGPKTIVEAMANSKAIAVDIMEKLEIKHDFVKYYDAFLKEDLYTRKGHLFDKDKDVAPKCLGCNSICELCVDVCPNRANMMIQMDDGRTQILHIDGMCNECGNCSVFCPQGGNPYADKFTVFWSIEDMKNSNNSGFYITDTAEFVIRHDGIELEDGEDVCEKEYVLGASEVPNIVWEVIKKYLSGYAYTWVK